MKMLFDLVRATAVICGCCLLIQAVANGQPSRNRKDDDAVDFKELQQRLQKAEENLVEEYKSVVVEVYEQGDKVGAMKLLKRLKELNPRLPGLNDRIDEISEELMQENTGDLEIDTKSNQWQRIGGVFKDKTYRIQAGGEYRLTMTGPANIDGLQIDKDAVDFEAGLPVGCLMAMVAVDGKPGKPFRVGAQLQQTPRKDGILFMKMNVPTGTRCTGKIKIRVSGNIAHNLKK